MNLKVSLFVREIRRGELERVHLTKAIKQQSENLFKSLMQKEFKGELVS
jgi:hypothetical protein